MGQNKKLNNQLDFIEKTNDSIINRQNELKSQLDTLIYELNKSKSINDSINKELTFYRVKEDYYSTALSTQSTRFALIISGVLALFGILSFSFYKIELIRLKKSTKKRIDKQTEKFIEHIDKIEGLDENLNLALGNLNITIALLFLEKKLLIDAFKYYLIGSKHLTDWNISQLKPDEKIEERFKTIISNLRMTEKHLDEIIDKNYGKEEFKDQIDKINKILNEHKTNDYIEITNLIASIRVKSNTYAK
jgi:hypothetical protein